MIETSSLYKALFAAGAMQEYKIEIAGVVYDQNVIYDKTEISENLFDTDTFTIGSFTVSSLRVKLWLESHEIPRNAEVGFYYRYVSDVAQSEWILKFAGNVVDRTRYTDEITTIEAYSKAANYDVFLNHFGSAISSYPANARTVANLCATHLGLTIENIYDIYDGDIVAYPNELTMVQVLQNIAKSSGGNWAIVGEDNLRLVVLENTTPTLEYRTQTVAQSELLSPISMVRAYWKDDSAFEAGDDSGSVLEIDNPWATQENTDYLLGTLGGYEYVPVNGKGVYADPALQLGDTFKYSNGVQQTAVKVKWTFDGITTADIETPQENEISYDNPYDILAQQEFKKKVTLGESYQGVTIGRETGIQTLLSPDGTEENAVGRYYADLNKGMAFQTRPTPSDEWHDWMYFDMDEKTFKLQLYSTKKELQDAINTIELTPGPATYTWVRYADDVNGSGISNDPTGKTYIGFAYNKLTATESNTASDYTWSLIQGPKGDTGVKGDTGANGQTLYTWIKYSDNADGTGLYDIPTANTLYIGIATNKTTATESTTKTDYIWSKFKGDKGDTGYTPIKGVDYFDGVDGQDGKGIVSAVVRYQNHTNGITPPTGTWTENPSPIKGQYLWTRTITTYTDTTSVPTYSVAYQAIDGTDGTDGTDGRGIVSTVVEYVKSTTTTMPSKGWSATRPTVNKGEYLWTRTTINYTSGSPSVSISNSYVPTDGQNGTSSYLWVRYSQNSNGNPMATSPVDARYIGVATTSTSTAPTGYASYSWSLIKGQDGVQGETGQDGQTSYLHIKYSNDGGTTFTSNNGETVGDWIGTYVDFIEEDSDKVNDYTWNRVKGDKGEKGETGAQGKGISSTDVTYQAGYSGTTKPTGTWSTNVPTVSDNQYLWTRTIITYTDNQTSTAYSVGKMGAQGPKGDTGTDGKGISSTTVTYQASTSGTVTPTGTWRTTVPSVAENQYLWTRVIINYTSGSPTTSYSIGKMGAQGPQGAKGDKGDTGLRGATGEKGPKGDTGTSVSSVVEWYLATNLSSGVTTNTDGWTTTMQPITTTKKYLWNYEVINFSDGSSSPTIPVIIGVYGNTGATGRALTGVTEYYLASASASGVTRPSTDGANGWTIAIQTTSVDKPYLWNYEKLTWSVAPTTSYIEPIIIGVHGATGERGPQGVQGLPGDSQYVHIRYSANSNGNPMTETPQATTKYIGLANTTSETAPTGYSSYKWSLVKGSDGANGTQGPAGKDGQTPYLHIAWANDDEGTDFSTTDSIGRNFMGTYVDFEEDDSANYEDYAWVFIKGADGAPGPEGQRGENAAVFSDVPPEDTSRLWLDTSDNTLKQFMLVEEDGEQVEGWYPVTYHAEKTLSARIKIAEDAITSEVAERVDLKGFLLGEISTQVAQEAESITSTVTSVAQDLTTAEGKINKIETFFRIDGDGIALGKSDNKIEFYAEPNEIGFRQTGVEGGKIAYWKEGTMHVDNLIALKTIIVGHHNIEKYPSPIAGDSTVIRRGGGD